MSTAELITSKIKNDFSPLVLKLENESHLHSGPRTESHFKLYLVSEKFKEKSRVDRQRLVYDCLKEEFNLGLHALTMRLFTIEEHERKESLRFSSPNCSSKN